MLRSTALYARRCGGHFDPARAVTTDGVDHAGERGAGEGAPVDLPARAYIAAHADGWRNLKHRQQWANTLDAYASPVFGKLPVRAIDTGLVMRVLEPMWSSSVLDAETSFSSGTIGRLA